MRKIAGLFLFIIIGHGDFSQAKVVPTLVVEAQLQPIITTPAIPLLGNLSCTATYQGLNYNLIGYWSNGPITPLGQVVLPFHIAPIVPGRTARISCVGVYMDPFYRTVIVHGAATASPGTPATTIRIPIQ